MIKASELAVKDIINLADGAKLGPVKDVHIDLESGRIVSLVLEPPRRYFGLLRDGRDIVIPWEQVKKFGVDTVLVELIPLDRGIYSR